MRVFVTDGENRAALAVTRSLGRAGHEVIVGEKHLPALAHTSKYCAQRVLYPDPVSSSDAFVERLVDVLRDRDIEVLVPIADITSFLVTRHRDRFPASCAIPLADADVVERAANKIELVHAARRLGVPVPRSVVVCDPTRIPWDEIEFPVVIKPRQSRVRLSSGWASSSVTYAADREELIRDFETRPRHEFPLMLQERIIGPAVGVFACYHDGRPIALFSHRRLRERPPWGGVSVLSESVPVCPKARDYATRLLDDLGWRGVAMVEFKRDLRDGEPKLMEINGRFWGSLQLAIDAGVDFPNLLVRSVRCERFEPQVPYRAGVRNRWLWGDVDSLLFTLFSRIGPRERVDAGPVRAVLNFMKFWGRDLHYENPKWHDLRPWFFETYRRLHIAVRSAVPRTASSARPATAAMTARIVTGLDEVGLDENGWNALAARSDTNSVFQTHEWTRSWWSTYGEHYAPFFVRVSDPSGVKGVAPLVLERRSARDRIVRFLGNGRADYCDFLAGPGKAQVLDAVFDALRADTRWDVIELNNIPAESRTYEIVTRICKRLGYRYMADEHFPCPTLLVEGREAEAEQMINKPSLRRRINYFQRNGRLVCRNLTTAAEIEPYLDAFFAQHVSRWGASNNHSLFLDARNREFYRELTRQMTSKGWLLFSVVEFNDRPIAFHFGFDYSASVMWYKPSFDIEFEQHSPGMVMVRHLIDYVVQHRRRELDFTVGDEPFKRRFTNSTRKTVRIHIYRDPARYYLERSKRKVMAVMKRFRSDA